MTGRSPHPDPDGHHDDLDPSDAARLTLLVPDDARALEADRLAWLAERRDAPPAMTRDRLEVVSSDRPPSTNRPRRRLAIIAGLTAVAVLAMSVLGATVALFAPGSDSGAVAVPTTALATWANAPGQVGGLLPAVTLTADAGNVPSTDLRPAVLALVPSDCPDCAQRLAQLAAQAAEYRLPLYLVGGSEQAAQLHDLAGGLTGRSAAVLIDRDSTLRATYQSSAAASDALLLLLVRPDGRLYTVVDDPPSGVRLEASLVQISLAAANR